MPLEGGLYQWAKLGFNEFTGFIVAWNLWLLGISVMAGTGLVIATNLSYALGPAAAWLPASRFFVSALNGALFAALILVTIRGLSIGKWVHNVGAILLLITYGALVALPFIAHAAGKLPVYHPIVWALPPVSLFSLNIFSKMALGALSGFEYDRHSGRRNARASQKHRALRHHRRAHYCSHVHPRHELGHDLYRL